jgi:protein SCO1/2
MNGSHRKISGLLWGLVVLALVGVVVGKILIPRTAAPVMPQLFPVPDIALTDQDGQPFSTGQLRGHPWVADFIFTSCAGSCPMMSHAMTELQKNTSPEVGLVSFTVDPQHDTPAILKEYGAGLHADFSRWHFLTGAAAQMADAAYKMKISVRPADKDSALTHSDRFLLVDDSGHVVGIYDGTNADAVKDLTAAANRLAKASAGTKS